jgi:hypothetical protein
MPTLPAEPDRVIHAVAELHADAGAEIAAAHCLRSFRVLLRSARFYQKNHPRLLESLEAAERDLRGALELLSPLVVGVEGGSLGVPMLQGRSLPDPRGELDSLAQELSRCGITSLVFLPETNLGELDILAHLLNDALLSAGAAAPQAHGRDWPTRLAAHHISGIRINVLIERHVTVLASLVAALLAHSGAPQGPSAGPAVTSPGSERARVGKDALTLEELTTALRLLARLTLRLKHAEQVSPQEAARAFHSALAEVDPAARTLLATAVADQPPREGEAPEHYISRLVDALVLQFVTEEFCAGRAAAPGLRGMFARLGLELAAAARFSGAAAADQDASLIGQWAGEAYAEKLCERFWAELPVREKSAVLRGPDAWCVPVAELRRYLEQLADAGSNAPGREAWFVLLSYARCLESEKGQARRTVATGLIELHPLLERLWPRQWPEELTRGVVRALGREASPGIAALLAAVTQNLARLALAKGDYAEFERILEALENAPRDDDHAHLAALATRLVADESWLLLVDAALANRSLDPVLPRLLRRDPERLLDRLGLLLTAPLGPDALPAMARLLRAIGEPAIGLLEMRLFEPRRQRATAAVKLLAATQPGRLVTALPSALPSWDWNVQDLAVSELARVAAPGAAGAFLATVSDAHPLVAPMMLDQIGLTQESAAVPLLLEIAAGENERLSDLFIRIKAIEALGRMRVNEAADLLGEFLQQRNALTYAEPAGLRAAAEEALALIENLPSSARVRATQEALEKASLSFARPRRYPRIPLSVPLAAQIEGARSDSARVRTISLGGAFLESNRRLRVGDSIRVEIRSGLRRIRSTAVVRNIAPNGGGVEFVHMKQEDHERLRRLMRRLLRS